MNLDEIKPTHIRINRLPTSQFKALPQYIKVDIDDINLDEPLSFSVYFPLIKKKKIEFHQIVKKGLFFTSPWKEIFRIHNIRHVFIHEKDFYKFFDHFSRKLSLIIDNPYIPLERKNAILYRSAEYVINRLSHDPRSGKNIQLGLQIVENYIRFIMDSQVTASIITKTFVKDSDLFAHSVQVSFLSLAFGHFMRFRGKNLFTLGAGTLFHDLGKIEIPYHILNKPSQLTPEEFEIIKLHPEKGYTMVYPHRNLIPDGCLEIILQHHEDADGNGYPNQIKLSDMHPGAQIIRIIDSYDSMTTDRPYRASLSPFEALKIMCTDMKSAYNIKLLESFILFLGR